MADPKHIRGDTFLVTGAFSGGDYSGWVGKSQVRDDISDDLLSELEFTWVDATQGIFTTIVKETGNWPANKYVLYDVEITSPDGQVRSSLANKIQVLRDVTRAGP